MQHDDHQFLMLRSTYEIICKKIDELQNRLNNEMPEILRQTYDTGGYWHDNAQWEHALKDQEKMKQMLEELVAYQGHAIIIDDLDIKTDTVQVGVYVTIIDLDSDETEEYFIGGPADVSYGNSNNEATIISVFAPVAQPLLGKKMNEEVRVKLPSCERKLQIVNIKN